MPSDESQVIDLLGRPVAYRLRRSAAARRCRVTISHDGVRVTLPRRAPLKQAARLLTDQAAWVLEHLNAVEAKLDAATRKAGLAPGQLLLRGQPMAIVVKDLGQRRPLVREEANQLTVLASPASATEAIEGWFRQQAKRTLVERVAAFAHAASKPPARINVRDQRTRWGSCSSTGTLSFSWRLLMTPPTVLDYVVIHELVHLDVPNHSAAFWTQVRASCPQMNVHRRWLREHEAVIGRPLEACLSSAA